MKIIFKWIIHYLQRIYISGNDSDDTVTSFVSYRATTKLLMSWWKFENEAKEYRPNFILQFDKYKVM